MKSIKHPGVAAAFESFPAKPRRRLLALRKLIFDTAKATPGVGRLEETLKWGEPAYLTQQTKSGSTIRIAWKAAEPKQYAIYFHCQTNLIESFRGMFPSDFKFAGNRSIVFHEDDVLPKEQLACCIAAALTYHLNQGL